MERIIGYAFKKPKIATIFKIERLDPDLEIVSMHIKFGDLKIAIVNIATITEKYVDPMFSISLLPSLLLMLNFFFKKNRSIIVDYATKYLKHLL